MIYVIKNLFFQRVYKHRKTYQEKQEQISILNNYNITKNIINSNNTINNKRIVNFSDNGDFFRLLSREINFKLLKNVDYHLLK